MMVNGVALSSGIAGGWGGGAVPNATGTAEFAIDVSGVDAQAATGGVRINFIPRDGGNRFSGTIFGSYAKGSFAGDNYTGTDVQQRGLTAPSTIKGTASSIPASAVRSNATSCGSSSPGGTCSPTTTSPGCSSTRTPTTSTSSATCARVEQAILHQDQQIFQARLTYQANQKNKFGVTSTTRRRYCGCPFGIRDDLARWRERSTVPVAAIRHGRLDVTGHQPAAARGERHPPRRAVGRHAPADRQGRQRRRHHAGHDLGDRQPEPGHRWKPDLPVAAAFNNSWNWNIHYRAAMSYITGSHNFKVGFNNAYLHHENTTYTDPTTPYSYSFANGVPTQLTYRITPRTIESERRLRLRRVRAGSVDGRPMDAGRAASATTPSRTASPSSRSRRRSWRRTSTSGSTRSTTCTGRTSRRRWARPTTCSATAGRR